MNETIEGEVVGTAVAVREETRPAAPGLFTAMRPAEKVAYATEVAGVLKDVLVQRNLIKRIGQSDHVELEGWQTCASIVGVSAKIEWTRPLENGQGWESRAVVVMANGVEVGAGEGMCSREESTWKRRDDFAIRAMAQTRAMSRALRGVLAWIVVLAGYRPTPAEEMVDVPPPKAAPPSQPMGLTLEQARARKENGGGGPVGVAEAGCSECHAPAGKQHATRCSRKRAETWDAEAESRDPSPSGERRAADVKTAADDARRTPAPSEDPKTTTSEARPPADEIRGISEAQRGLFFATLANTPLADDRELRHSWYEEIGVPGTSAAWSRDDFDKALAAADREARRALASRKAAR